MSVGSNPVETLVIKECPVLTRPYSILLREMDITGLKELVLQYGQTGDDGLEPLVAGLFSGLDSLLSLKIQSVHIGGFHRDTFSGLGNLTSLYVVGTDVGELPQGLLHPMPELRYLDLLHSDVNQLPGDLLETQRSLKILRLTARGLKAFPKGLFDNQGLLEDLTIVSMNFDSAGALPPKLFEKTVALKNITLRTSNGFELAPPGFLGNLKSLENFWWSFYYCSSPSKSCNVSLNNGLMKDLPALKKFVFNKASRVRLDVSEDLFEGCGELREVSFETSGLVSLPSGLFKTSPRVRKLYLQRNNLDELPDTVFRGLTRLEEVSLSRNRIETLGNGVFQDLRALKKLDLSQNNISSVGYSTFYYLSSLEELNLSDNALTFGDDDGQPNWSSLNRLRTLSLANNELTLQEIPFHWTTGALEMNLLNLSRNRIGPTLNAISLNFQQSGIRVDLSNNSIETIDMETAIKLIDQESQVRGRRTRDKAVLKLDGNPLNCDCRAVYLAMLRNDELGDFWFDVDIDNLRCQKPAEVRDRLLAQIDYDSLFCRFPSDRDSTPCPTGCRCFYSPHKKRTEVSCREEDRATFPEFVPAAEGSTRVSLDLAGNSISVLKDILDLIRVGNGSTLASSMELELLLSDNKLMDLEELPRVSENLRVLELDGNHITTFPDGSFDALSKMESIKLGRNPYACDCESLDLYDFVRANKDVVSDLENVTVTDCSDDDYDGSGLVSPLILSEMQRADVCPDRTTAVVIAVAVLIIICLVVFVLVLVFKETILIWVYSHKSLRYLFPGDPLESDKVFDAFISYSGLDAEFVEGLLVPGLEEGKEVDAEREGGGGDLRYRCLVHERDFRTGENIQEQILDAVARSRRTVIVLSKNFVRSPW